MEQLNLFDNIKVLDDGFKYDYEGKFIGLDIKRFSIWWENEKELSKSYYDHIDNVLKNTREFINETNKLIGSFKYRSNIK